VSNKIIALMSDIYDRALAVGRRIEEGNPAPGNIAGGITTLNEKALGNVKKGGTAPIEGVLGVGEYPTGKGLYVLDNPGLDPISLLGLVCSSANILLYSTGRGTPVGNPIAPAIKLTGSPDAVALFHAHMDVELTGVLSGEMSLPEAGWRLFDEIIKVANGKQTIAEKGRHREFAFPLLMGPL
jgi:altronate dehydratase large subunit